MTFLDRLFGERERIHSGADYVYLERWHVATFGQWKVYLHKFLAPDGSRDLHDHPKRLISIGIWGSYVEQTPGPSTPYGPTVHVRPFKAPWIRSFPASHVHRIAEVNNCWTICIVGKPQRYWGFWVNGHWYRWDRYVALKRAGKL